MSSWLRSRSCSASAAAAMIGPASSGSCSMPESRPRPLRSVSRAVAISAAERPRRDAIDVGPLLKMLEPVPSDRGDQDRARLGQPNSPELLHLAQLGPEPFARSRETLGGQRGVEDRLV